MRDSKTYERLIYSGVVAGWLASGSERLSRAIKNISPVRMNNMNYTIDDFRFGETLKSDQRFFMAIDTNVIYGSIDDLISIVSKLGNQVRRFKRQQQIEATKNV
jgi:hypothetical protein